MKSSATPLTDLEASRRQLRAARGELQQARSLLVGEGVERGPQPGQQALPVAARARHRGVRSPVRHAHLARAARQQLQGSNVRARVVVPCF